MTIDLPSLCDRFGPERLIKIARGVRHIVPSLHIAITDHCFNNCPICGHWKRKDKAQLDAAVLERFLAFAGKHMDLETVALTGGDPLAHPEIMRIMQHLYAHSISFGVVTAGFVTDPKLIRMLTRASWVRVSLDAVSPDIYRKVRGGVEMQQVADSVLAMAADGVNLQLGITVSALNAEHLPAILSHAACINDRYERSDLTPAISKVAVRAVYHHSDRLRAAAVPVAAVQEGVLRLRQQGVRCEIELDRPPVLPFNRCAASRYQLFIDASGYVYACCVMAGDTESKPVSQPIANIGIPGTIATAKHHWSQLSVDRLPAACTTDCPTRLNLINHCYDELEHRKDFY